MVKKLQNYVYVVIEWPLCYKGTFSIVLLNIHKVVFFKGRKHLSEMTVGALHTVFQLKLFCHTHMLQNTMLYPRMVEDLNINFSIAQVQAGSTWVPA